MNDVVDLNQGDQIREDASIWVVRIKEGLSDQQEKDLSIWLEKHPKHRLALIEIATAWDELDIVEHLTIPLSVRPNQRKFSFPSLRPLAVAALLLVSVIIGWIGFLELQTNGTNTITRIDERSIDNTYQTAIGEQSKISLRDGSTVSLNTSSEILVEFSNTERKIELVEGEALFNVKPDKSRPFVVIVGEITIRAVGTSFNVFRTGDNAVEVLVSEGKVAVYSPPKKSILNRIIRRTPNELELSAREAIEIKGEEEQLTKKDKRQMESRLAWTSGMLVFDEKPLEQVITELSRYSETIIEIGDPSLKGISVAGYFKIGDIDALLYALSENFDLTWKNQDENLIVLLPQKKAHPK